LRIDDPRSKILDRGMLFIEGDRSQRVLLLRVKEGKRAHLPLFARENDQERVSGFGSFFWDSGKMPHCAEKVAPLTVVSSLLPIRLVAALPPRGTCIPSDSVTNECFPTPFIHRPLDAARRRNYRWRRTPMTHVIGVADSGWRPLPHIVPEEQLRNENISLVLHIQIPGLGRLFCGTIPKRIRLTRFLCEPCKFASRLSNFRGTNRLMSGGIRTHPRSPKQEN
jgi:hypothetical protein